MEKSKSGKGAGGSGKKTHPHPSAGDLIALGTKRPESGSNLSPAKSSSTKSFSGASKGSSSSSGGPPAAKKLRMSPPRTGTSSSTSSSKKVKKDPLDLTPASSSSSSYLINTVDLSSEKFFNIIDKAYRNSNTDLAENLLVSAVKRLKSSSAKDKEKLQISQHLILSVKNEPYTPFFRNVNFVDALVSLVQHKNKDVSSVKAKLMGTSTSSSPFAQLALIVFYLAYREESHWPIPLIHLWVEDATGDRSWVDLPLLKPLVENLLVSFGTILPSTTLLPASDGGTGSGGGSSPNQLVINEDSSGSGHFMVDELKQIIQEQNDWSEEYSIKNRFASLEINVETIIVDFAGEVVQKKSPDIPKNLLKALSSACGLSGVRTWIVTRVEQWLHNGKLGRVAQDLLLHLCVNSNCNTPSDMDVISQISKLRMKTKPLINFHSIALREMVKENENNLRSVLNLIIYNELSTQRHPNNLPILGTILASVPESRTVLAETFIELLQKREDFHQALRLLLREIVRTARHECDLLKFVVGLIQHRDITWLGECRERAFLAIADLILLSMFLSVSPQVREASAVAAVRGEPKDISTLINFRNLLGSIQSEAVTWLYSVAPKMFKPSKQNYLSALNKIFLKDPVTDLMTKDGWPPESEKNLFGRLCQEVGLQESSLVFILMMGLSKEHPVSCNEAVDIVDHIVLRAATHKTGLSFQKIEIIELLFRLSEYRHPDNISLPLGYEAPKMAVSNFYWRVWAILCVICAFNPKVFGQTGWSDYPTLKVFMEMCMTNSFVFPTASCTETETSDEIISRELQTAAMEKEEILEFETHLAAASSKTTITESNSLLLKQLMRLDPFGSPRNPPPWILNQLQLWNEQMGLGHQLCGSRNPDFLLDLIQRNSEPMPWLARLVSEGSFEILPDQCLCEFLMGRMESIEKALQSKREQEEASSGRSPRKGQLGISKDDLKLLQLLNYLQEKVQSTSEDGEARKVLEYFLRRLSAPKVQQRSQALNALKLLIKEDESSVSDSSEVDDWLLDGLPALHVFTEIQENVLVLIRQAILIENEPALLCRYLEFLSTWATVSEDLEALALDVAGLVVERNGIMCLMMTKFTNCFQPMFDIFSNFCKKVRGPHQESYKWSDSQDQVLVTWTVERLEGTMNILIIHAIVILLSSYAAHLQEQPPGVIQSGKPKQQQKNKDLSIRFSELLDIWFPRVKENNPKGFLLNTSEEAVLFPDWVKLKMIRSNNPRLLEVATQDLEVDQLILFIQAFGIPVQTMTALLYIMDTITQRDEEKVVVCASMVNATLIYNIIQAQWKRGVSGGERFVRLLTTRCGVSEPMECSSGLGSETPKPLRTPLEFGDVEEKEEMKVTKDVRLSHTRVHTGTGASPLNSGLPTFSPASEKRKSIENLSKELLHLASPPSNRRRSSVPVSKSDDPLNLTPRRHSAYVEDKNLSKRGEAVQAREKSPSKHLGELVDEMTLVEPCIVGKALEFQLPLLFGKNENSSGCRSFLMTALAHQAGWETIDKCLTLFLKEFDAAFCAQKILDLIQATQSNPKLWQGVDKYTPKHQPNFSVMKLKTSQLGIMADYIVEEISQGEMKNTKFSISNLLGPSSTIPASTPKKPKHGLQNRVRLWLQCAQQDKHQVDAVIKMLMENKWRNPCVKRFIQQVYVEFPEVILIDNWRWKAEEMSMAEDDVSSLLDGISHGLITALANTKQGKEWGKKQGVEYEICLRKLASLHPTLLLRQINLMGSLLEGRVHLASSAFHLQNHNLPFIVFLALFELMQPHILRHFKELKSTFLLYFKMFQNYGTTKDYSSSLSRFAILLHNFLSVSFQEVKEFLGPHYATLRELSTLKYYTEIAPLHNLLSLLDPISSQGVSTSNKSNSAGSTPIVGSGDYLTPIVTSMHDRLLHTSNDEEVLPVLQELDALSNRNPSVLNKFSENLNMLLKSQSESCRSLTFSLVLKHSTYFPGKSSTYVDSILLLLEDENAHLRETIIDRIHEFVILAQERAEEMLQRMFQLGISSNVNFLAPIQKSLGLLRNYSSLA